MGNEKVEIWNHADEKVFMEHDDLSHAFCRYAKPDAGESFIGGIDAGGFMGTIRSTEGTVPEWQILESRKGSRK